MLKLKPQYFGHLMQIVNSLEKTQMLRERLRSGGEGGSIEMVGWHLNSTDMSLSKVQEIVKDRDTRRAALYGVTKSRTRLSD